MNTLKIAFIALRRNALRTTLTTLSISIGIAAVMAIVALGSGTRAQVESQIDSLGEDFVWIEPGSFNAAGVRSGFGGRRSLKADDAVALANEIPDVASCSPQIEGREQIIAGNQNWNTNWRGVAPAFFNIRRWELAAGTFFSDYDITNANRVLVLGPVVAERLFPNGENPVGAEVRMGRFPWKIIGVLQGKGASRNFVDRDDVIFVPHTTAVRNLTRKDYVDDIMCDTVTPEVIDRAEFQITSLLRIRHDIDEGDDDDFSIRKPEETIAMRAQAGETMATLLVAIASVSLLVGGVGIMNIMLVSVTERTREIGLRLAVGARMWDIRFQFLVEAAILGVLGGVIGTVAGWAGAKGLTAMFGWPAVLSTETAALAVAVAMSAGLVFGYYPAHRASGLDPIDALRTEA